MIEIEKNDLLHSGLIIDTIRNVPKKKKSSQNLHPNNFAKLLLVIKWQSHQPMQNRLPSFSLNLNKKSNFIIF